MAFYEFEGIRPVVGEGTYIHPNAVIIGDVWIGENCYIGPFASLRGDFGRIRILSGSNVQDNCVVHGFPDYETLLEENTHIGHSAIIHTATIRQDAMVGMGAVVLDYTEVGKQAIVGAHTLVPTHTVVPERALFAGVPGEVKKILNEENLQAKRAGTEAYHQLTKRALNNMKLTEPITYSSSVPLSTEVNQRPLIKWQIDFDANLNLKK